MRLGRPADLLITGGRVWTGLGCPVGDDAGSYPDLAVLSADYFTIPQDDIPSVSSDLTVVGGRIVHTSGPFSGLPLQPGATRAAPAAAS
jgi:hypothetical protein